MAEAPAPNPDAEQQPDPVVPVTDEPAAADTVSQEPTWEATVAEAAATAEPTEPEPAAAAEVVADEAVAEEVVEAVAEEVPAVAPPADIPSVASTLEVPAQAQAGSGEQEGGEWELLLQKLQTWIGSGQLQAQWQSARTPLSLLAGLIAVLLVLRVYSAVLNVLDSIPLLSGLLELAGLVAVVQFSLTRLVRSEDRREVIGTLKQRWSSFRGRS